MPDQFTPEAREIAPGDVAVIGIACRVPGAVNKSEFWELLRSGREARTTLGDGDLEATHVPAALRRDPNYVKAGMFLPQMEQFDPGFFGFSPLDGRIMDPQHRHFLECAWEALEDAAYDPTRFAGAIGVFAGSGHNAYLPYNLLTNPDLVAEVGFFLLRHTGNDKDFLTTRASYCFDLRGPSVNIQTACSTSLVAIHAASQSLLSGECDLAMAGGVTIELPHRQGYLYKDSEILSRDGHCRPFDASAGGTVFGSGVGVVVLKRLDLALQDGDHVYAVVKSSAVNNDGAGKVSYLAPSVDGQAAAIREALAIGNIDPQSVSYVETHGTGTQLGDPIEVAALVQAYGAQAGGAGRCRIGSVKSNIGHLDTAAGVASFIKVVLAMQHGQLPATLHYSAPNPAIDFAAIPFYVNGRLSDWRSDTPLRAGVSSLGVGGTNAHVVVEQAPPVQRAAANRSQQLLLMSARSEASLLRFRDRFAQFAEGGVFAVAGALADAAYTLAIGRKAFRKRAFMIVEDQGDIVGAIERASREPLGAVEAASSELRVAFMFAGGGAQFAGMGRGLFESEPVYRDAVNECLSLLREFIDFDLRSLLQPVAGTDLATIAAELERPSRTLPALFVVQYAQAQLWKSWGVQPAALIGHSMGENTAACIAGVFSLRDALGLVALRGRLFETVAPGSMLSVELSEQELASLLDPALSVAAVNAPGMSVASGPKAELAALEKMLTTKGVGCKRIRIDIAAHSSMLNGILKPFGDYLRSVRLNAPNVPFVSNLTGEWIAPAEAMDPEYWVRHLRNTVRFSAGVGQLLAAGEYALLEVGPGRTMASLAGMHPGRKPGVAIVNSMRAADEDTDDLAHMLGALGRLWAAGAAIDWSRHYADQGRRRIPLPTYAFDHQRCWVEPGLGLAGVAVPSDRSRRTDNANQMLYQPVWQAVGKPVTCSLSGAKILLLGADDDIATELRRALAQAGAEVRWAAPGKSATFGAAQPWRIRTNEADDWLALVDAAKAGGWQPTHIVHTLALGLTPGLSAALAERERPMVFDSLFHLAQLAANEDWQNVRWTVVTHQRRSRLGCLVRGPVTVLPHEFPGWSCQLIDLDVIDGQNHAAPQLIARLMAELAAREPAAGSSSFVALRAAGRYVHRFAHCVESEEIAQQLPAVRADGVYLITGGTGGLGLAAARALAAQQPVTLVLLARHALPERQYWPHLVASAAPDAAVLAKLLEIEQAGARLRLECGDVSDRTRMQQLAATLRQDYGAVHGILHTAGVIQDGLLASKEIDSALQVLEPKLSGTLNLVEAFDALLQDFFLAYSSTSAFVGLPGQFDYAAANAFLDGCAEMERDSRWRFVSVNWPAWREVGMAATALRGDRSQRLPAGQPVDHPLLHRRVEDSANTRVFATLFEVPRFWLLAEHRLKNGAALIPGSGFLEIARAAYQDGTARSDAAVEFRDVAFELPFVVGDREGRVLRAELIAKGAASEFRLVSDQFGDQVTHVTGQILAAAATPHSLDIAKLRARCGHATQLFSDPMHHPFMQFGQRWESLRQVHVGRNEAVIDLELKPELAGELTTFRLHPAMIDMATAGAQVIIDHYVPTEEFYVPIGYRRLWFSGALPPKCVSHVRLHANTGKAHEHDVAMFDVTVADEKGQVCLIAEGFSMRRLPDPAAFLRAAESTDVAEPLALKRTLELGIDAAEGAAALLEILRRRVPGRVLVSAFHPDQLQKELLAAALPKAPVAAPKHDPDADPRIAQVTGTLAHCQAISQVVVRSFRDASGDGRLVAYFLPDLDRFTSVGDVRRYARENLPVELIPQQFVEVDAAELSVEGQIDRQLLRDPLEPADSYSAPRTTTEKALARIWQDALGVERVGLADNFFDLGGHSLLSTRVIIQTNKRLGVRLDQATMVLNTLEQVAKEVDVRGGKSAGAGVIAPAGGAAVEDGRGQRGLLGALFGRRDSGK